MEPGERTPAWWRRIGEDWWAVILGAALIALVYLGVLSGITF